jgi:hypothetical protein
MGAFRRAKEPVKKPDLAGSPSKQPEHLDQELRALESRKPPKEVERSKKAKKTKTKRLSAKRKTSRSHGRRRSKKRKSGKTKRRAT